MKNKENQASVVIIPNNLVLETSRFNVKTFKQIFLYFPSSESGLFISSLILLLLIAFGKNTDTEFRLNNSLRTAFVETGQTTFNNISNVPAWWQWAKLDLLDALYWQEWYGNQDSAGETVSLPVLLK